MEKLCSTSSQCVQPMVDIQIRVNFVLTFAVDNRSPRAKASPPLAITAIKVR